MRVKSLRECAIAGSLRRVMQIQVHRDLSTSERRLHLTIADLKEVHRQFHLREQGVES